MTVDPFDRGEDYDEMTYNELWDMEEEISTYSPDQDGRDEPELPVDSK